MANYYVRSGAAGAGTGADWANAYTTLTAALSGKTSSDVLWVADDHSETTASAVTLTCPSTPGLQILGVNTHTTEPPTALNSTPTAQVSHTTNNAMIIVGFAYINGIIFQGSNGNSTCSIYVGSSTSPVGLFFDNCKFDVRSTSTPPGLLLGGSGNNLDDIRVVLRGCQVKFGSVGSAVVLCSANILLENFSLDSAGSAPTSLFKGINPAGSGFAVVDASDLSGESWSNLVNVAWAASYSLLVKNCKLPSGYALSTGTHTGPGGVHLKVHNCDSGDTNYNYGEVANAGTIVDETTLVRSGGGTISYRMDANSNTRFPYHPLELEGAKRNTSVGSALTLTVEILHDSATNLQNDEIWVEVQHLGTSGVPLGTIDIDDRAADVFATPADQTSSSETWTTTGMSNPNKQKLSCTFTPQEAGYVHFKVCLAPATAKTVYVDMLGVSIA